MKEPSREPQVASHEIAPSPHISSPRSTRGVMIDVIIALAPAMVAAGYYYRIHALILIATCIVSCVAAEWLCNLIRKTPNTLGDCSAVVTGILLAMSLPPRSYEPSWAIIMAAVVGSFFAITIGKMVFGGLGSNIFNPAMVGRAFLTVSFGVVLTTWTVPATIDPNMPRIAPEYMLNARTQATPLAWSKMAIKNELGARSYNKEQFLATITGEVGGCLGETSAIALIIGGLYLLIRRTISVHIPLAVLLSAFIFAAVPYVVEVVSTAIAFSGGPQPFDVSFPALLRTERFIQPLYHLTSGGLLLGAFFIATDPVTAPLTRRGMWLFGLGVGTITMLIRIVGEYPEGVMFSVLLMNAVTPLIDRLFKRVPAGGRPGG